jgi:excinuclease ABC subunit A
MRKTIEVKGARENNLKNIDVQIPRETLTVITGVSGSGKSTLAYDVIYSEGQRRLLDSLSAYSRRFVPQPRRADVDFVFGLSPVVAIMQKSGANNPRSTIGTLTDAYDYLRLLFCVTGAARCPYCGRDFPIKTVNQLIDKVLALPQGASVEIRVPVVKIYGKDYAHLFAELRQKGCRRLYIDGALYDSGDRIDLDERTDYAIEVLLDRIVVRGDIRRSIETTIERGLRLGEGFLRFELKDAQLSEEQRQAFYQDLGCAEHHMAMRELEPYYFSFNDPDSACRTCTGLGTHLKADPRVMIADPRKSLRKEVLPNVFINCKHPYKYTLLYSLGKHYGFSLDTPWEELPEQARQVVLYGTNGEKFELIQPPDVARRVPQAGQTISYEGLVNTIDRYYRQAVDRGEPVSINSYWTRLTMTELPCPECGGTRLKPQRMQVVIGDKNIADLSRLPLDDLLRFLQKVTIPAERQVVGEAVLRELLNRIKLLIEVGVGYLSLDRNVATISGGEAQRVRLSTQIGSGLMGMMYILDEPSIGLHPRDGYRIINTMKHLRDMGNTVIVVEHDTETICAADHIIEMGPGPGIHGGTVVVQGTVEQIKRSAQSITGQYLSGRRQIAIPAARRPPNGRWLKVVGAREHNLQNITVDLPLGVLIAVTGVSGSGKSSLIHDVLYKSLHYRLHDRRTIPGDVDCIDGIEHIDSVININQSPLGSYWTSNPATYSGMFGYIRDLFTGLPAARQAGFTKNFFSFNSSGGGCCEECGGRGLIITPLQFLPNVETVCPACKGKQFRQEVLEIHYQGKNIADVLAMSIEEAADFFRDERAIARKLKVLNQLGLGYLKLGQSSSMLSGGEAQRVKLATELAKVKHGHRVYILDEPTTGLHLADIQRLLDCLDGLVESGHTVIVIEHNLEVIKTADYIIDLGPEGGSQGGYIVAQGTPEEVARAAGSHTGRYLASVLAGLPEIV